MWAKSCEVALPECGFPPDGADSQLTIVPFIGTWDGPLSAARIDSRVGDRLVHRTEILPIDLARFGRRQTGQVVC
jgi:hypothetical protein